MRFRNIYMILGSLLVLSLWLVTDPDIGLIQSLPFGVGMVATLIVLLKSVLYVTILHISRRALLDYLDLQKLFEKAMERSEGAGSATIAVAIIILAISITIFAATYN